jgi:hypothetical protein
MHIHVPMIQDEQERMKIAGFLGRGPEHTRLQRFLDRIRYLSESRTRDWYNVQRKVAEEMGVPFLDCYQASVLSADYLELGDGRHFSYRFNAMVTNWFTTLSPAEVTWRAIQRKHRFILHRDASGLTKSSSRRGILVPSSCSTLVDFVNAALVSLATGRALLWIPGSSLKEGNKGPAKRCELPINVPAEVEEIWNGNFTSSDLLVLDRLDHLLSLKDLEGYASDPSSPWLKQVQNLFFKQTHLPYGIMLLDFLRHVDEHHEGKRVMKTHMVEKYRTDNHLEPYDSIVVAVQMFSSDNRPNLRPCLSTLLLPKTTRQNQNLACHVMFASEANAREWADILDHEFGCTALVMPADLGPQEDLTPAMTTLHTFLSHLELIATTAGDGYILPRSMSSESEMFLSMIHYMRSRYARTNGMLPVDTLPYCVWE